MKKIFLILAFLGVALALMYIEFIPKHHEKPELAILRDKFKKDDRKSVDHSKFAILNQNFSEPQKVTEACLSCHTERGKEVMNSNHWNWEREEYIKGRGVVYLGKKNALNNFCIGTEGNDKSCAKCHIGYGMGDNFEANAENNIDCMVCHDNTETYAKAAEKGGAPVPTLDFRNIATHIGKPKRSNCGVCHFFGGGGNNVKHGDLDKSMFAPTKDIDVHMAVDGANLECIDCHKTEHHNISGKLYTLSSMNRDRVNCEDCHSSMPHKDDIINNHGNKVACQTCHIPEYAKVNATKTHWDWSSAGKLKDGQPYEVDDKDGNHTYLSIKGTFHWGKKLKPEYTFFNGTANHYLLGDIVKDTNNPVILNELYGNYQDNNSKIIPNKVHRAVQPFDPINKMLIQPKLYADNKGEGALWKDFDWIVASEKGMANVGLPFSGNVSFVNTEMNLPINHMVSKKENAVQCEECHNRTDSRLANVKGFYMIGRDSNPLIETAGIWTILLTFAGVFAHLLIRVLYATKIIKTGDSNA